MSLKLYNTLTNQKEVFTPLHEGKVSMYTCGPTVYGKIHIGNIKSYLTADVLRRHLTHLGYEVRLIKNITDVGHLTRDDISQGDTGEDKMEKRARQENTSPEKIARIYEEYFKDTENKMNILSAQFFPRATGHVPHMIKIIEDLIASGHAYESNGNVFFDIETFSEYGKLSGNTLEYLQIGARLEEEHPNKKNQWDFALWLKASEDHIMRWESPWSVGYPGWHIECSAMSMEHLGEQFDIHTGGEDNIFPHHEAEIAQSECSIKNHPWVKYWVHTRHLLIDNKKMSKSKGTMYILEDVLEKGYSVLDFRLFLMSAHYRSQMNFTWDAMDQAAKNMRRISEWVLRLRDLSEVETSVHDNAHLVDKSTAFVKDFWNAMDDDLNSPLALSHLYEFITLVNGLIAENTLSQSDSQMLLRLWENINSVLGLTTSKQKQSIPEDVQMLIDQRDEARKNKDFEASDRLRDEIQQHGYTVEDTKDGTKVRAN